VKLVYVGFFGDINEAISWEKRVKGWNRKKKEALIRRAFEELPELSKRRTPFKKSNVLSMRDEEVPL